MLCYVVIECKFYGVALSIFKTRKVTTEKSGMTAMASSQGLKLVLLLFVCGYVVYGDKFEHNYDTEEFTLKSTGILRPIVQLSEENGVQVINP